MRSGNSSVSQIRTRISPLSAPSYVVAVAFGDTLTFQQWPFNISNAASTASQLTFGYASGPGLYTNASNFSPWDTVRAIVPSTNTQINRPTSLNNFTLSVSSITGGTTWQLVRGFMANFQSAGPGFPTPVSVTSTQTGLSGTAIIDGGGTYTFNLLTAGGVGDYFGLVRVGHVFSNSESPGYLGANRSDPLNTGSIVAQLSVSS
jgi:hypothetical protein